MIRIDQEVLEWINSKVKGDSMTEKVAKTLLAGKKTGVRNINNVKVAMPKVGRPNGVLGTNKRNARTTRVTKTTTKRGLNE